MNALTAEEVLEMLKGALGDALLEHEIRTYTAGTKKKREYQELWIKIDRKAFRKAVEKIFSIDYPHLHFISGEDTGGDIIEVIYSFALFHGIPWKQLSIVMKLDLPKSELVLPSITDMMIGAETNEREIREMLGIEFDGLKNKRHLFLPDDWPEGKYPWRKDEYGVDDMIKHTHKSVREIRREQHG